MSDNALMIEDFWAILRRRKLHAGIPAAVILLLSVALAYLLPRIYVSTATIAIEQQEIPENLVASSVTAFAAERVEMVRMRVMTKANLWAIAEKFHLYPHETVEGAPQNQQELVEQMRKNISIAMVTSESVNPKTGRTVTPTIAFTVSYGNESPELAQAVTSELAQLFVNEDRVSRTENAQQASSFLNDEAQRLQRQIADIQAKIAEFRVKNAGYLPESFDTTSRLLETSEQQREQLDARLSPLESRYAFLKNRLIGFGASAQLSKARADLAAAREKYSEIHPDVIRLKETVANLEAAAKGAGGSTIGGSASSDPAYLELQSQLQQVAGDIDTIRSQRADLNQKIAEYQSRLARSPEVEGEYSALTRDLDHATGNYRQIMDKVTSAQLSAELERTQKGQRFTLSGVASYPTAPSKPNIPAIMVVGLTFALGFGGGIAGLAEYLDHRIHGPKELAAVFKAPPLATIPEITG